MAPRNRPPFQWNAKAKAQDDFILEPLLSYEEPAPLEVEAGKHLVELSSALRQLRKTYLSSDQRAHIAAHIRRSYLAFQRLAARATDEELRTQVTHYLAVVGAISLAAIDHEESPRTLLEALATDSLIPWAHHFYSATHGISERSSQGRTIRYHLSETGIDAEREARRALMHWLEEE